NRRAGVDGRPAVHPGGVAEQVLAIHEQLAAVVGVDAEGVIAGELRLDVTLPGDGEVVHHGRDGRIARIGRAVAEVVVHERVGLGLEHRAGEVCALVGRVVVDGLAQARAGPGAAGGGRLVALARPAPGV